MSLSDMLERPSFGKPQAIMYVNKSNIEEDASENAMGCVRWMWPHRSPRPSRVAHSPPCDAWLWSGFSRSDESPTTRIYIRSGIESFSRIYSDSGDATSMLPVSFSKNKQT